MREESIDFDEEAPTENDEPIPRGNFEVNDHKSRIYIKATSTTVYDFLYLMKETQEIRESQASVNNANATTIRILGMIIFLYIFVAGLQSTINLLKVGIPVINQPTMEQSK